MNKIIEKTYELIDAIDNSSIINNLTYYKDKLNNNNKILELVKKYNNTYDNIKLVAIKKELYNNKDYKSYIYNYNKLHQIIIKINHKYKKILNSRSCNI